MNYWSLTITAGLNRRLDITDTLDSDAVLVVTIDVLILELANLVHQHTELVSDVRDILIAALAPDGELLLFNELVTETGLPTAWLEGGRFGTYGNFHALLSDGLQTSHDVLFHLDELRKFLGQVGPESTAGVAAKGMAYIFVLIMSKRLLSIGLCEPEML